MNQQMSLTEVLQDLESEALSAIGASLDADGLETIRISYLGRKDGRISQILRKLGEIDENDLWALRRTE
jgi:hypothetical protein